MAALKADFAWGNASTYTSDDWLRRPDTVPPVLDRLSETSRISAQRQAERDHDASVRRLRANLKKDSRYPHRQTWDKSHHPSRNLSRALWRRPDTCPAGPPDLKFRPEFKPAKQQLPWFATEEFPQACQEYMPIAGRKISVGSPFNPNRTFQKQRTTDSYNGIARPLVAGVVKRIDTELSWIPNEGVPISMQNYRDGVQKDLAEMKRVNDSVKEPRKRPTLRAVVSLVISMNRWTNAAKSSHRGSLTPSEGASVSP